MVIRAQSVSTSRSNIRTYPDFAREQIEFLIDCIDIGYPREHYSQAQLLQPWLSRVWLRSGAPPLHGARQKRPLGRSSKPSRKHPSIVSQAPSWGTKTTTFFRYILIPIEASDPLPATLLERFSESSRCLVARSITWYDCDRTDPL